MGKKFQSSKNGILVGDIIKVVTGMNIPVDGIVISGIGI